MDWQDFHVQHRLALPIALTEAVNGALTEIDNANKHWLSTTRLLPHNTDRLLQRVVIVSTTASARLSGHSVLEEEVEWIARELHKETFQRARDQEIAGYLEILTLLTQRYADIPLTSSSVLKIHHQIFQYHENSAGQRGHYRDETVRQKMQELIKWYQWAIEKRVHHPIILLAHFIFEYLTLSPFHHGNKRSSRLLTQWMLLQQGYSFVAFSSYEQLIWQNLPDYRLALTGDASDWVLFFLHILKMQTRQNARLSTNDAVERLLSVKQLAFWQWLCEEAAVEFSRKDAIEALGFPARTVESIIKKLVGLNRLERLGQGKATRYKRLVIS